MPTGDIVGAFLGWPLGLSFKVWMAWSAIVEKIEKRLHVGGDVKAMMLLKRDAWAT